MPTNGDCVQVPLFLFLLCVCLIETSNVVPPGTGEVKDVFVTINNGRLRGTRRTASIGLNSGNADDILPKILPSLFVDALFSKWPALSLVVLD